MQKYRIAELYESINGEGLCAGELAVFVRVAGCSLKCSYCDTAWVNLPDTSYMEMTADEIAAKVQSFSVRNVTVTGGEPLCQPGMYDLLQSLCDAGCQRVEIETNGSVDLAPFRGLPSQIVFTMDYKTPGSGMEERMILSNFSCLREKDSVKFVISDRRDLERAYEICAKYHLTDRCHVLLSPVFDSIEPSEIVDFMKDRQWNDVRLQIQIHKVIWDKDRRGV